MKVSSSSKSETTELKNETLTPEEQACLCSCNMGFQQLLGSNNLPLSQDSLISVSSNDSILSSKDIKSAFNYDTFSMDKDDASFFVDMVTQNGQFALNMQGNNNLSLLKTDASSEISTYKSADVSKTLVNLIDDAYTKQKPVRIDFDNNVSVILKVDKQGVVSADFIPGDKAVEDYLRNNIGFLKQKFDDQNLSYNDLSYRQNRQQQQSKKKNKGE